MKAIIKIISKFNQSVIINKVTKERASVVATKVNETLEYTVNPKLPKGKQLNAVTSFVSQAIGARYKAVLLAGKKLPAKLFFEITLDGEVYRSETALVKANFVSLCAVSLSALKKLPIDQVIQNVSNTQTTALKVASGYISDLRTIAANVDKETFKDAPAIEGMKVEVSGELVTA